MTKGISNKPQNNIVKAKQQYQTPIISNTPVNLAPKDMKHGHKQRFQTRILEINCQVKYVCEIKNLKFECY